MEPTALAQRYAAVKAGIPPGVTLVAVSKTRSVAEIQALYDLGHRAFGENYPQELREKAPQLPGDITWHFIGHLQRSNVKHVVPLAHLIHGVEDQRLLDEVQKRAAALDRTCDVLLQVHIAQEETKHGLSPEELRAAVVTWPWAAWPNVRVRGLMGMATNTDDAARVRAEFEGLKRLFDEVRGGAPFAQDVPPVLSMGMSGDASIAIAAGSTLVRIGTAIFGAR
ncbi:MAG: YggS family pyridoxal phosphate-dependent enzyme [Flavobacteriales bacterium]|nr:YggS family pyridoxal phosphate-dependent enzyme [Flavobacteriales bacterium]